MTLHKRRFLLTFGLFLILLAAQSIESGIRRADSFGLITGVLAVLAGALVVGTWLRPLGLRRIDEAGLHLRLRNARRVLDWTQIAAVILDKPTPTLPRRTSEHPVLLLVPVDPAFGPVLKHVSPIDERSCLRLLNLDDVREDPSQIADAIRSHLGNRFIDRRAELAAGIETDFAIVLRGYDTNAVDELITDGRAALATGTSRDRHAARARLESPIMVALRGYECTQVDAALARLATALATWVGDDAPSRPPAPEQGG